MSNYLARNRKIAEVRGESWRRSLLKGKSRKRKSISILALSRVKLGLSQDQLSKMLQICLAAYGSIERGRTGVKIHKASYIASIFQIQVEEIFYEHEKKYYVRKLKGENLYDVEEETNAFYQEY
jgi:DNA-binding XRE family transcriptional regulator